MNGLFRIFKQDITKVVYSSSRERKITEEATNLVAKKFVQHTLKNDSYEEALQMSFKANPAATIKSLVERVSKLTKQKQKQFFNNLNNLMTSENDLFNDSIFVSAMKNINKVIGEFQGKNKPVLKYYLNKFSQMAGIKDNSRTGGTFFV